MTGGDWKSMFQGVQENDIELVVFYLNKGIDPNYQHPEFMALPLSESIRLKHFEITELLISKGANPVIIELESGISPLQLAQNTSNKQVIDLLLRSKKS